MSLLETIKQKLDQIKSSEEALEEEIEENSPAAVEDSEKVLHEIEELDREFVDLLISENAEETFNSAINIIKWERDLSNFLDDFSTKTSEIEQALRNSQDEIFFQKVNQIKTEIRQLSSSGKQLKFNQTSEKAIFLLENFGNLEKEFEWFENAVETFDREERLLEKTRNSEELELERSEIQKVEQTIPRLESQINDLRDLAESHKRSKLRAGDFEFDTDLGSLKSSDLNDRKKAELEHIISLIDDLQEAAETSKNGLTRRSYNRMLASALTIVTGSFFAKEATEFYPEIDVPGSERGEWSRKDEIGLNGLKVAYKVKGEGSKADMVLKFQNTSDEILNVEAAVEIPKSWKEKSSDMKFQEVSNMSDQMSKKFHLVPSKQKNLELMISEISDDTRGSIHLKIAYGTSKSSLQEKTVPIDMVS